MLALGLLALAGCGDEEPASRTAAPTSSPEAAELSCGNPTEVDLEFFAGSGDPVVATRALLEDELRPHDTVEKLSGRTTRVVRGGRVVAVVRFTGDGIEGVSACPTIAG